MKNKNEKIENNFFHYFNITKHRKIIIVFVSMFTFMLVAAGLLYTQSNVTEESSKEQSKNKGKTKLEDSIHFVPDYIAQPITPDKELKLEYSADDMYIKKIQSEDTENAQEIQDKNIKKRNYITITVPSGIRLSLEVVADPVARQLGLMFRKSLSRNSGMIFVFQDYEKRSFWMQNTSIPLSLAYLDEEAVVLQIEDMVPFSTLPVRSNQKAKYVIEVNKDAFESYGITVGSTLFFLDALEKLSVIDTQ